MPLSTLDVCNEKSTKWLQFSFFNRLNQPVIPSAVYVSIYDEASNTAIRARAALTSTLATVMEMEITSDENKLVNEDHQFELRTVTVEYDDGSTGKKTDEYQYNIKNLKHVSST
jgi:hypothetical protein